MLNVNDGHNPELMEHCRTLKEYAQYVAKVRKYAAKQNVSLESAMTQAVDECIAEGILADFLLKNKTEVIKVSIYEYDKEFEEKKLRKAEYEAGRQDGIEIGRQDGIEIGITYHYPGDGKKSSAESGWITAPFTMKEIIEYKTDSEFWNLVQSNN